MTPKKMRQTTFYVVGQEQSIGTATTLWNMLVRFFGDW
jgi:hypothetical protein